MSDIWQEMIILKNTRIKFGKWTFCSEQKSLNTYLPNAKRKKKESKRHTDEKDWDRGSEKEREMRAKIGMVYC